MCACLTTVYLNDFCMKYHLNMRPKRASARRSAICLNSIGLIFMQAHKFGRSTNMGMEMTILINFACFPFHQVCLSFHRPLPAINQLPSTFMSM